MDIKLKILLENYTLQCRYYDETYGCAECRRDGIEKYTRCEGNINECELTEEDFERK